jgi:hypothetical protein
MKSDVKYSKRTNCEIQKKYNLLISKITRCLGKCFSSAKRRKWAVKSGAIDKILEADFMQYRYPIQYEL